MMPLLLVLCIQSSQLYQVCQNIILVYKKIAEYQYKLNDTRWYCVQLRRHMWVSMLELKTGFQNIAFECASSYELAFIMYQGTFQCLTIPMGLI